MNTGLILTIIGIIVFVGSRIIWSLRTYSKQISAFLTKHDCKLLDVTIPHFWQTGPFPKVAIRCGAIHTKILGIYMSHFEYRIVTFEDKTGTKHTLWVRLLINALRVQDIIWEPDNNLLPDSKGWPNKQN